MAKHLQPQATRRRTGGGPSRVRARARDGSSTISISLSSSLSSLVSSPVRSITSSGAAGWTVRTWNGPCVRRASAPAMISQRLVKQGPTTVLTRQGNRPDAQPPGIVNIHMQLLHYPAILPSPSVRVSSEPRVHSRAQNAHSACNDRTRAHRWRRLAPSATESSTTPASPFPDSSQHLLSLSIHHWCSHLSTTLGHVTPSLSGVQCRSPSS